MRKKQSADNMMKTPVPTIILQLDLTSTPIKVNEAIIPNADKTRLVKPSSKILELNLEGAIPITNEHCIEATGEVKLGYYVDLDIRSGELINLETIAFVPQDQCYNLIIEVKDRAPKRAIVNANVHGFIAWGSETISHWETLVPRRNYYIVRDTYNLYSYDNYILAWKTRTWLDSILNSLSETSPILKGIYDDNIVIVESKMRTTSYGLILLDSQEGLLESIADMIATALKNHVGSYLKKYILGKIGEEDTIKANPFKALELLVGEETIKSIIRDLVKPCTPKDTEYLIHSIYNYIPLNKDVLHRLFAKDRELNVRIKCSHNDCIIENIGDVSAIELEFKRNNDIVLWSKILLDKNYSMKIRPKLDNISVELEYY